MVSLVLAFMVSLFASGVIIRLSRSRALLLACGLPALLAGLAEGLAAW